MAPDLTHLLFVGTVAGYAAVTALYAVGTMLGRPSLVRAGFVGLVGGFAAHSLVLALGVYHRGAGPPDPVESSLAIFSWCLLGAFLASSARFRIRGVGGFLAPVALFVYLSALVLAGRRGFAPEALRSVWFPVHTVFTYAGLALFGVAFASGVGYLILERRLRRRAVSLTDEGGLPSLEVLDRTNHQVFTIGLLSFTLGIIAGSFWAASPEAPEALATQKVLATLVLWLVYALGWQARLILGWRGRRAAVVAIVGFVGVLVSVVGISHV